MAISIATDTEIPAIIILMPCVEREATVQFRIIVVKLRAGKKIHVSIFAMVLLADSGKIFVFAITKPMAMQVNSVSIGVKVAKKVPIISPF